MAGLTSPGVATGRTATAPPRALALLLASGAVVIGAFVVLLASSAEELDQPGLRAALACWVTTPYIVAGVIAWRRRPDSRLGVLMVVAGYASFLNFLIWSGSDALFTLGIAGQFLPPVLFLHVYLAYPDGRLESAVDRVVVVAAYASAGLTLPAILLGQEGRRDVATILNAPVVAEGIQKAQLAAVSVLLLAGVVVLVLRRLRDGPPARAALGFLVDSFMLALVSMAVLLASGLFEWTVQEPIRLATFLAIGLAPIVLLAGLLQARLGRSSLSALLEDLGVAPGPAELQDAVASALRDPSAVLAYWLPTFGTYADIDGRAADLRPEPGRAHTSVTREGRPVAMIVHAADLDDPALLRSVAAATGLVIENARLQVELRAKLEELRGSRARILDAEQAERRRLERDLHDGAQQRLAALSLELGLLRDDLAHTPTLQARADRAADEVAASLDDLRNLAHGIHPATVSDHGLPVALESMATCAALPVQVTRVPPERLPSSVELTAFFVVSEALANAAKHARASSATVTLDHAQHQLVVSVVDDGVGGADPDSGGGLRGLADRVEAHGGRLRVWSAPGAGTRVTAEIPCAP
jgi:signal transduction histidine kinase